MIGSPARRSDGRLGLDIGAQMPCPQQRQDQQGSRDLLAGPPGSLRVVHEALKTRPDGKFAFQRAI